MAPLTIRVRSRDRTVRVAVEATATVSALRQAAAKELGLPLASVTLSAQPSVRGRDGRAETDANRNLVDVAAPPTWWPSHARSGTEGARAPRLQHAARRGAPLRARWRAARAVTGR
jgi:hypothetical protein